MKLLLVEDTVEIAQMYIKHLTFGGHEVVHTTSGLEAMKMARQRAFDVIVLDLNLPDIDGSQVGFMLRDKLPTTPLIAISSDDSKMTRKKTQFFGFDKFISKPISMDQLLSAVRDTKHVS